jgi:hypothetical protein
VRWLLVSIVYHAVMQCTARSSSRNLPPSVNAACISPVQLFRVCNAAAKLSATCASVCYKVTVAECGTDVGCLTWNMQYTFANVQQVLVSKAQTASPTGIQPPMRLHVAKKAAVTAARVWQWVLLMYKQEQRHSSHKMHLIGCSWDMHVSPRLATQLKCS